LEGAVMKQVDSHYVSGRKGWNWVKIKEAEGTNGKLSDTLDCIVMGYYVGRGKRNAFGIGALLVGVLDTSSQQVVTIAKIGTGLSDEQLQLMKQMCDQHAAAEKPSAYVVAELLQPDVWVKPALVLEIAADELTNSPNHSAKVALRFPRLIKVRDDKSWEQATTTVELAQIKVAG
jgi:DNA ligase 1